MSYSEKIVYFAGLIDGEANICIEKKKGKKGTRNPYTRFLLILDVANSNMELMHWLKANFKGYIVSNKPEKSNHKIGYHWRLCCQNTADLLEKCLPYLIVKKDQAKLAILFQKTFNHEIKRDSHGRIMRLDQTIFDQRTVHYQEMKVLNKKGR